MTRRPSVRSRAVAMIAAESPKQDARGGGARESVRLFPRIGSVSGT
jgi:hypothetical protein